YVGQGIIIPILFAILLASILLPLNKFLERKGFHRVLAILLSLLLSLLILGTIIYFLVHQISNFLDDLPTINQRLDKLVRETQKWISHTFSINVRKQNQYLTESGAKMKATATDLVGATFLSLTQALSYLVLLPIYSFLILYYRDLIKKFLVEAFTNSSEKEVRDVLNESQSVSQSYIAGLMIEMTIVFSLNSAGFLIVGIKYAIFLALVAALLNLIPYIGMIVANIFCMLITLISCEVMKISDVFWVFVVLALVQFIDNNFLMPMIVGSKVRINALVTIVGVLVGGALCGVPGMFLAIPGLAVLKVVFDRADGLKPYGMLLGDNGDADRKKKKTVKTEKKTKGDE
ncbi:MAG TPA: AI-2E family transporter, partial [Cyclobacteriaceae bacterium]|nr:AI-2E family transporter [Cyclobacteriaceae bacterium]